MKWFAISLICLFPFLSCSADEEIEENFFTAEEEFALENEIDDFLEENEGSSPKNYETTEAIIEEDDISLPIQENARIPLPAQKVQKIEKKPENVESIALEIDHVAAEEMPLIEKTAPPIKEIQKEPANSIATIEINLREVFSGSPIIYSILLLLSVSAVCIWLYSMFTVRALEFLPPKLIKDLRSKLISNQFDEALDICSKEKHFFCKMLASGILARKHGISPMVDTMKAEGKRRTVTFWQRISLLNEVAIIAPMLGLLGTVMGMFYAFYDLNRSIESVSLLFDGLGISVGTTVAGLIVAILAMILHSVAKYRLVRILTTVENEAQTFAALIDTRGPDYLEK